MNLFELNVSSNIDRFKPICNGLENLFKVSFFVHMLVPPYLVVSYPATVPMRVSHVLSFAAYSPFLARSFEVMARY